MVMGRHWVTSRSSTQPWCECRIKVSGPGFYTGTRFCCKTLAKVFVVCHVLSHAWASGQPPPEVLSCSFLLRSRHPWPHSNAGDVDLRLNLPGLITQGGGAHRGGSQTGLQSTAVSTGASLAILGRLHSDNRGPIAARCVWRGRSLF